MIYPAVYVDRVRCNGCGECVGVCPAGAITLRGDKALIEESLCDRCEVCLGACPEGAILFVEAVEPVMTGEAALIPASRPAAVTPRRPQVSFLSLRDWVLPAVGSALVWAGREIMPRLASLALDQLDRRTQSVERVQLERRSPPRQLVPRRQAGGRRHRRRQRNRNGNKR